MVFIETKLWISDYGYDERPHAFGKSAGKLGVEQIDLLLLHQPVPTQFGKTVDAYRALEKLFADGGVRAIGVSNFMPDVPAALLDRRASYQLSTRLSCTLTSPSRTSSRRTPNTGSSPRHGPHGRHHQLPRRRAEHIRRPGHRPDRRRHGKTPAQVMLRWHLQEGRSAIPKSVNPERIAANFDVFDFELTTDQIAAIDYLNTGARGGPEPETVIPEAFGRDIPEA